MNKKIFWLLSLFIFTGCAANLSVIKRINFTPGERTLKLAILPFSALDQKGEEVVRQVREEVAANLQEGNYEIIELSLVDQYMASNYLDRPSNIPYYLRQNKLDLHKTFGADLLLYGKVIEWTKTYLALHSDVELDIELYLYDARSGKMIAKIRKGLIKNSGISRIPTGYFSVGTAPLFGLKESVQQGVIHDLTREISQPLIELNRKKNYRL